MTGRAFKRFEESENRDHHPSFQAKIWKSSLFSSTKCLLIGIICLVGHVIGIQIFPVANIYNREFIAKHNFVKRWGYAWAALTAERLKYFFAWKVAEGASILSGFGFRGYAGVDGSGGADWSGVENVNIWKLETATSIQVFKIYFSIFAIWRIYLICFDFPRGSQFSCIYIATHRFHALYIHVLTY